MVFSVHASNFLIPLCFWNLIIVVSFNRLYKPICTFSRATANQFETSFTFFLQYFCKFLKSVYKALEPMKCSSVCITPSRLPVLASSPLTASYGLAQASLVVLSAAPTSLKMSRGNPALVLLSPGARGPSDCCCNAFFTDGFLSYVKNGHLLHRSL